MTLASTKRSDALSHAASKGGFAALPATATNGLFRRILGLAALCAFSPTGNH